LPPAKVILTKAWRLFLCPHGEDKQQKAKAAFKSLFLFAALRRYKACGYNFAESKCQGNVLTVRTNTAEGFLTVRTPKAHPHPLPLSSQREAKGLRPIRSSALRHKL